MNSQSVNNVNYSAHENNSSPNVTSYGDNKVAYSECRITTVDNPFDPFDQFDQWFLFDVTKGYNTCDYLGRVARTADSLSDAENAEAVEQAIDDIIRFDPLNPYRKVKRTVWT